MSTRELIVRLPARVVGTIVQDTGGRTEWRPDTAWASDGQLPRLGVDFLRTPGPRKSGGELPAWFENLLPERDSTLRGRLCAFYGLPEGASFRLLTAMGRDLPGAVEARAGAEGTPRSHQDPVVETTSGIASDGRPRFSALAGMQMKFSMSMVNERLTLAAVTGATHWIVKLPGPDFEDLPEVETATMRWAARAGLDVPAHRTVPFEALSGIPSWGLVEAPPVSVFAVERFDRRPDASRVHQEDLCQALGLRPSNKNGDRGPGVRFDAALRFVDDVCGENEGRKMARRLGFMIASGNGDAHLKNWALLWGDAQRPLLAPCYDLVATISWAMFGWENRGGPRMALRFGTTRRFADIDDAMLARFSDSTGRSWAKDEIIEGICQAREAIKEVDVPIPVRMESGLREHWRRVPILRQMGPLR
ncbi:MAG: HipA domain-containing protein [Deltaproteobacteria bacterium]|nr:HipA domain-containing protein [Deltaproteobacteria bacterium]